MTDATTKENQDVVESKEKAAIQSSESEQFFRNFTPASWFRDWPSWQDFEAKFNTKIPKVDIIDQDSQVVVKAEVPGIEKENLDVTVTNNTITIKGETRSETKEEKDSYVHSEIRRGSFSRTVALPCQVNTEGVQATFKDGILELRLSKSNAPDTRKITIE